jgi:MFS family permease
MQSLAQAWLVYRLTHSPFMLGLVEFLMRAPILVFSVAGGVLADRWSRHRLLVLTQTLSLLQAAALAGLTLTGWITIDWILLLALVLGIIHALDIPIRQAFVGDLVPKSALPSAIGLNSSIFNAARIIGPSIAGPLVVFVGEGICFAANALSYLLVLACLAAMQITTSGRTVRHDLSPLRFVREGLAYAWHTPHVRVLLAMITVLSIAAMPHATLLPVFAGEILRVGPSGLGWFMAATGIGALLGALGIARRQTLLGLGARIALAVALYAAGLLTLALSHTVWLSVGGLLAIGFGMITSLAGPNTLLQSLAPDRLRGRVMSLYATVSLGFTTFGSLLAGLGAAYLGAPLIVMVGGIITLLTAVVFWRTFPKDQPLVIHPASLDDTTELFIPRNNDARAGNNDRHD